MDCNQIYYVVIKARKMEPHCSAPIEYEDGISDYKIEHAGNGEKVTKTSIQLFLLLKTTNRMMQI